MKAGLVRFLLVPFGLAGLLLWPLFVKPYHLGGGAAVEVMMASSLKAVFNRSLLQGQFPLWNDWAEAGKVFLLFGSVPLHPYTVLELLFDPALGDRFVAIEILINYVLVAAMMLAACRYLDIHGWAGCLGFLAYVLFDPVPVISHIPWWWAGAFVAGPFMILIVMMHPSHPPPRLRLVYCALALFFVTGTKPEVLYMFLLYVTLLTFVLAAVQRSTPLAIGASLLTYVAVPFSFYAWQIPLVRSLLATSTIRFRASPESAFGIIENIYLSLLTSDALRIGLVTLAGVVSARFLAASVAPAQSRRLAPPSFLHPPLTSVGLLLSLLVFVLGTPPCPPALPAHGCCAP